ncbi:MAG: glycosyltransferase family 9 protein, partial [Candidatus Firestonebacteria bacterium]
RWGKEKYAELADRLMELQAFSVLFFTDPLNKTLIPEITGMMKNKAAVIGAKSIREVSGVISKLSLYIGNDSGLSHIAAGLNTPTITIVGPDEAAIFHPYPRGERHFIVSKDVSCKPCWKENCDKGNTCLDKVTVNEVYKVVEKWKKLAR